MFPTVKMFTENSDEFFLNLNEMFTSLNYLTK